MKKLFQFSFLKKILTVLFFALFANNTFAQTSNSLVDDSVVLILFGGVMLLVVFLIFMMSRKIVQLYGEKNGNDNYSIIPSLKEIFPKG